VHRLPASLCVASAHSLYTIIYCYYRRKYPVAYIPVASYAEYPQLLERLSGTPPQHTALLQTCRKTKTPPKSGRSLTIVHFHYKKQKSFPQGFIWAKVTNAITDKSCVPCQTEAVTRSQELGTTTFLSQALSRLAKRVEQRESATPVPLKLFI